MIFGYNKESTNDVPRYEWTTPISFIDTLEWVRILSTHEDFKHKRHLVYAVWVEAICF